MTVALTNDDSICYCKEVTWGVTPGATAGIFVRTTGLNSQMDKDTVESAELVTSREVADIIQVAQRGGLSFPFELSYGNLDDFLESLMGNAWATNVLTVGATRKSLSIQRQMSSSFVLLQYLGSVASQLSLNVALGRIITGTCALRSKAVTNAADIFGSGKNAGPQNAVMDPVTSLQLAQEGGSGAIAGLSELSMTLSSSIIDMPQIGSVNPLDLEMGQLVASGTFSCYFQDATYLAKHLAHTSTSLSFTFGGASNLKYNFLFSKVRLTLPDVPNSGPNAPLIQQVQWKAYKDATNTTLKITRTP